MDTLQRFLAWYLGLSIPRPGEGTAWRFDWRLPEPQWLVLVIPAALLIFVTLIYRRDGLSLSWQRRSLLIGLRLALLTLMLGLLAELSLTIERTGLPYVAVMIDTSASMSLEDQYPQNSKAYRLVEEAGKTRGHSADRLTIAQHLLTRHDGQLLRQLQQDHQVRLYRFSETAVPLESGELGATTNTSSDERATQGSLGKAIKDVSELRADGDETRPAPAVKKVVSDLRGTPPAAIILFTDGVASVSDADKLSTIAESVWRTGVQLHVVGLGSESAAKDLYLFDTLVDEVAFIGDPITFKAKLRSFGYAGKKIALRLRKEGERTALVEQDVTAPPDGQVATVELAYTSPVSGEFDYVLEVVEQSDETNQSNNSEVRHVSIREDKIRVLLADGSPRYEFRFLKQLLERDRSIELSTLLQDADVEYSMEDKTAISHFPVKRDELARFDVLIIGDLAPAQSQLGNSVLENVREFVREKGGSVVFIAGPQSNPMSFAGTPLESLLPFDLAGVQLPSENSSESFHPALTIDGQKGSSLFRLGSSEAESLAVWNSLPNLTWLVGLTRVKPGARVFVEHPLKSGANGRLPVILMQQVAAGKVLFHATDESWRWRFRTGDLYYGRYWIQAIRYLSRGRMIGKDRTAELTVDQQVYQRGQPTILRVRFADEKFIPPDLDGVGIVVERKGEGRQQVQLARLRDLPTAFEGQLNRLAEGTYHAWISKPAFNEAPPSVDFRVEIPQRELTRRSMDRADLQFACGASHGAFYTLEDVDHLISEVPRGTPVPLETNEPIPLWNRWELFVVATSLLTTEWLLRKHWKLV